MITTVPTPTSRCRFGFARADITPPVGMYHRMWGAATHDRSTGVHRPLEAAVMAFAASGDLKSQISDFKSQTAPGDSARPFVVLVIDHCLLWTADVAAIRSAIMSAHGLAATELVLTFTHTHAAGLMDPSRRELPGGDLIAPYLQKMTATLVDITGQALKSLKPATISYATGRSALAEHRDAWDEASKQYVCGLNPGGNGDQTLVVARITGDDGQLIATAVNYGCHPTTLAWDNTLISPDYPGAMRETVERATGAPSVFLQGASGDMGPRHGYVGDTAVADKNGRELAYSALATTESLGPPATDFHYVGSVISGATLGAWEYREFPQDRVRAAEVFASRRVTIPLDYIPNRPTIAGLEADRKKWQAEEIAAREADDSAKTRDARAMVERLTRSMTRWQSVPDGPTFPYQVNLLRIGDAVWVTAEGEPYNYLQTELRRRFPKLTIIVMVLGDGWRCSYLPTKETYDKGIYQEQIALLAPGSLERMVEVTAKAIAELAGP